MTRAWRHAANGLADGDAACRLYGRTGGGDVVAFGQFYDLVVDRVFGVVRGVVGDEARAAEVTQDVMIELWRSAARWDRERGTAVTFAVTVAHRRAVDCARSEEAQRAREPRDDTARRCDVTDEIAATVVDRSQELVPALAALPDHVREPIILAFCEGRTHREIAARLDVPLGTVRDRINAGLLRLRADRPTAVERRGSRVRVLDRPFFG